MPLRKDLKRVLIIGSGPIVIGQAAGFDYAGTQACKALKQAGLEVVLVNPNPATIMTDNAIADSIYIEPLSVDVLKRIIQKEKPDGHFISEMYRRAQPSRQIVVYRRKRWTILSYNLLV